MPTSVLVLALGLHVYTILPIPNVCWPARFRKSASSHLRERKVSHELVCGRAAPASLPHALSSKVRVHDLHRCPFAAQGLAHVTGVRHPLPPPLLQQSHHKPDQLGHRKRPHTSGASTTHPRSLAPGTARGRSPLIACTQGARRWIQRWGCQGLGDTRRAATR